MSVTPLPLDARGLRALLSQQGCSGPCTCTVGPCPSWESVPDERWPKAHMQPVGTLRQPATDLPSEATFEEHHPQGTRYESAAAPVAPAYFPFNRCDVFACQSCHSVLLKYTEYGGYYIDHRVRAVQADLIVDAALPPAETD